MSAPNVFPTDYQQPLFLSSEQQAILGTRSPSIIVEALAGTGKTTTLACRAVQVLRQQPGAQILVLTHSKGGVLAFEQRLRKLIAQPPRQLRVTSMERWSAQVMRQRDPQLQFVVDPLVLRAQVKHAMKLLQEQQARRPDPQLDMDFELDLQAFWQFNQMAKKHLLLRKYEEAELSLAAFCELHQLDYRLARLWMNYESLRSATSGDLQFCAEGDCTYALAMEDGVERLPCPRYTLVLMDEMHDIDEAALRVLQRLLQDTGAHFMGAGDFNQHIDAQALSIFQDQLQHLIHALPLPTQSLPLRISRRFGPVVAQAVNHWFGVGIQGHPQRYSHVDHRHYQDDADCVQQLLRLQQQLPTSTTAEVSTTSAASAAPATAAPLHVILRHAYDSCALQWAWYRAGVTVSLHGLQPFYVCREPALLLGLMYAHSTQAVGWKPDDKHPHSLLPASVLSAFLDGALYHGKGQHQLQVAHGDDDDEDATSIVHSYHQALQQQRQQHQAAQQEMAQHMYHYPQAIWNFLMDKAHLQGGSRNFAAFGRFLQLPQSLQSDARALLEAADIWALFDHTPMPHDEHAHMRAQVQAFLDAITGMSVEQVLRDVAAMAQRHGQLGAVRLLSIAHAKGQEFDYVALPFLRPGRFPAPVAHRQAFLERNRLYVAMTRVRKRLWLLEDANHRIPAWS